MKQDIHLELLKTAVKASANAYAPYSNFRVGAAVETKDGKVFVGANMENASYGVTMCAEVGALQSASTAGELGNLVRMAVVGGPASGEIVGKPAAVTPCGRCRQLLLEASHLSRCDLEVWCGDLNLQVVKRFTVSELLPHGFGPLSLEGKELPAAS